jgi:hypothetical protein
VTIRRQVRQAKHLAARQQKIRAKDQAWRLERHTAIARFHAAQKARLERWRALFPVFLPLNLSRLPSYLQAFVAAVGNILTRGQTIRNKIVTAANTLGEQLGSATTSLRGSRSARRTRQLRAGHLNLGWGRMKKGKTKAKPSHRTKMSARQLGIESLEERRVLAANVWVNDSWIITNNVGSSGLSPGDTVASSIAAGDTFVNNLIFGTDAFSNLQSAISSGAVTDGTTIHVLKGTYFGDTQVSKSVTIFLGSSSSTGLDIQLGKTVEVTGVTVQGFTGTGILVSGTLTLTNSVVSGGQVGIDVYSESPSQAAVLNMASSRISNSSAIGLLVEGSTAASANVQLSEISATSTGKAVSITGGNAAITGSKLATVNGTGLELSGTGSAVVTSSGFAGVTGGFAVANTTASDLNASGNYWGTTSASSINALVSGSVDFSPYLEFDDAALGTIGFQADNSHLHVTALGSHVGTPGRINEALALLADGSLVGGNRIIDVNAGTFNETVTISKSVKLRGANAGIAASGTRGAETIIAPTTGTQQTVITPNAANITLDGLQVQVNQNQLAGAPIAPVGIGATPTSSPNGFDGLTIKNTKVTSIGDNIITGGSDPKRWTGSPSLTVAAAGIVLYDSPSGDVPSITLTDNSVSILSGTSFWQRAVWLAQLNAQLTGNTFTGVANDLQFQFASGGASLIQGNQFTGLHAAAPAW